MAWLTLTGDQFRNDLIALGFHVVSNTGPISTWRFYDPSGNQVAFTALQPLLDQLAPGVYYYEDNGYHYVQQPGAVNPSTGKPATVTSPTAPLTYIGESVTDNPQVLAPYTAPATTSTPSTRTYEPGSSNDPNTVYGPGGVPISGPGSEGTSSALANVGITYADAVESAVQADPTIDGETLRNQLQWTEDAAYDAAVYGPLLAEAFGSDYTSQEWYLLASGAQGSGLMRAKIAEAQNRVAFREAYRLYNNGADPSPADYDAIMAGYVSPNEYVQRMAAKESAKEKFSQINELLQRTLNHSVTLAELENMVLGGKDSGILEALIDEATRLDAFTDDLYQWLGRTPTADDYAREVAKYPSVDAFKWEITVQEQMKEMGDEINNILQRAHKRRYTEQELRIMLGKSEGWGDLQKQYNEALKWTEREDKSRLYGMQAEKITPAYTQSPLGGFRTALPELADLGGMI